MAFRWQALRVWILVAIGLGLLSLVLLGIPGALIYEGWRICLNTLLQREMIANTSRIGAGAWAVVIQISVLFPVGLPLNYGLASWLMPILSERFAERRSQILWLLLLNLLWSLLLVMVFSQMIWQSSAGKG